jgi:hypothetical protein
MPGVSETFQKNSLTELKRKVPSNNFTLPKVKAAIF